MSQQKTRKCKYCDENGDVPLVENTTNRPMGKVPCPECHGRGIVQVCFSCKRNLDNAPHWYPTNAGFTVCSTGCKRRVNKPIHHWYFYGKSIAGVPEDEMKKPEWKRRAIMTSPVIEIGKGWVRTESGSLYPLEGEPEESVFDYIRHHDRSGQLEKYKKAMGI